MAEGPGLRYRVDLARPEDHLAHVTVTVPVPDGAQTIDVTMPAWCPGSYLIRDYARFVRGLTATDKASEPRRVTKLDKQTWRIETGGARDVVVRYQVYGNDLTVRTNHIDPTHAFLHGPATFVYAEVHRSRPVEVEVVPPSGRGWKVTTGMSEVHDEEGESHRYRAASVDELFDMPIHAGVVDVYRFTAGDAPFELAIWGDRVPGGVFTPEDLVKDLARIASEHVRRVGEVPFARYAFVLMLAHDAYGGLEHRNSSINLHNPHALANRKQYEGLLELLSHELFHAWNGKRIAPAVLLDFDYRKEAYTRCLWVMEGITSHYDRWTLRSSGAITAKSYFEKVLEDWTRLLAVPGRKRTSLEESSFDAWIKLYKPDESNLNTTVSYYLKGGLVMFALDLAIRRRTEGAKSLDDVLRLLWRDYGAKGVGHPEELEGIFEAATGVSTADVFARQIRGTEDPDLEHELAHVGLELKSSWDPGQVADGARAVWIGATVSGAKVNGVFDDGPAQGGGLSPGDEMVAIDDFKATSESDARGLVATRAPGDRITLTVFRRHRLVRLEVVVGEAPKTRWEIAAAAQPAPEAAARYLAWMGEPLTPGQSLCTITTTSRWL
jgi:predicted metalloprotease with PDZ domain